MHIFLQTFVIKTLNVFSDEYLLSIFYALSAYIFKCIFDDCLVKLRHYNMKFSKK